MVGYAAQVVSLGCTYKNLEGPVFGTRVGIYHSAKLDEPWWNETVSGSSTIYSVLPRAKASGGPEQVMQKESDMSEFDEKNRNFRLILYKLPSGTYEQSITDDDDGITTLPRPVREKISKVLEYPIRSD